MKRQFAINKPLMRFFVCFIFWLICLQTIVAFINHSENLLTPIQNQITQWVAQFYNLFFQPIKFDNNILLHPETGRYLVVDQQCTALTLCASLAAAIMAMPAKVVKNILFALMAIVLIQLENILRISHLIYEIRTTNNQFDFFHLYFWQSINFLFALCVFYFAYRNLNENNNKNILVS